MYTTADWNTGHSDAIKTMKKVTIWRRALTSQHIKFQKHLLSFAPYLCAE